MKTPEMRVGEKFRANWKSSAGFMVALMFLVWAWIASIFKSVVFGWCSSIFGVTLGTGNGWIRFSYFANYPPFHGFEWTEWESCAHDQIDHRVWLLEYGDRGVGFGIRYWVLVSLVIFIWMGLRAIQAWKGGFKRLTQSA